MEKDNGFKIELNENGEMVGGGFTIPSTDAEQLALKPTFDIVNGKLVQLEPKDVKWREDFRNGRFNNGGTRYKGGR